MRRGWALFFAFIALAGASFGGYICFQKKEVSEPAVAPPYIPHTWAEFSEIPRLKMLLDGFAVQTVAELPSLAPPPNRLDLKHYLGFCMTEDDARSLQIRYGSERDQFLYRDVTSDPLPNADLFLCWDYFKGLPPHLIRASIYQLQKTGGKFLLLMHDALLDENRFDEMEGPRPINWTRAPYNFPDPIIEIRQGGKRETLGLWSLADIPM